MSDTVALMRDWLFVFVVWIAAVWFFSWLFGLRWV